MLNYIKTKLKPLASIYFIFLAILAIIVTFLPWWPFHPWLVIPKYLLLFGPRWWLLIFCIFSVAFWSSFGRRSKLAFPFLIVASLNYLDFQIPSVMRYLQTPNISINHGIKIINANIGGGGSIYEIKLLMEDEKPDILLLQEARVPGFSEWAPPEYSASCNGGLCIISKLEFEILDEFNRKSFGGWGNFAVLYKIKTKKGNFALANIHMETPRTVLSRLVYRKWDQAAANKIESDRDYEALLISSWLNTQDKVIIAGDFNMVVNDNIYVKYFSSLNNALSIGGLGLNYTKRTSWHGLRIDHLLFSDGFILEDVRVINNVLGDHRPIVSTLYQEN